MLCWVPILVLSIQGLVCIELSGEQTQNGTAAEQSVPDISEGVPVSLTETPTGTENVQISEVSPPEHQRITRPPRRRPRRPRGFYNDMRYRNPSMNPYNPSSPYSFRGRPLQPQMSYQQPQEYNSPYYNPYSQYYQGYQGYAPQQQQYPYPYPPQARMPQAQPPTPSPTETIPDLYYVQKADSPDGQYQYKKVSVVQDSADPRLRRPPTRWPYNPQPAYGHPASSYYSYPYDPYNRKPAAPYAQQQYDQQQYNYPQQQYPYPQQQYAPYYQYPRAPYRPRPRPPRALFRATPAVPISWRLTLSPDTSPLPPAETPPATPETITEESGD